MSDAIIENGKIVDSTHASLNSLADDETTAIVASLRELYDDAEVQAYFNLRYTEL